MNAEAGGMCDDIHTREDSRRCGLAKALLDVCLKDTRITKGGGFHALIDTAIWTDDLSRQAAFDNCVIIIHLSCSPRDANIVSPVCKGYLEVAIDNNFPILFAEFGDGNGRPYQTMNTKDAKTIFEGGPVPSKDFIGLYGSYWFFCKCRITKKTRLFSNG